MPCVRGMVSYRDPQRRLRRYACMCGNAYFFGPIFTRFQLWNFRVVVVEVIVMVGQRGEVLCARLHVELHQLLRPPVLRLPQVVHLHPAHLQAVAVVFGCWSYCFALQIHLARTSRPAPARIARWFQIAELRIAEPLRQSYPAFSGLPTWKPEMVTWRNVDSTGYLRPHSRTPVRHRARPQRRVSAIVGE